MRRSLRRWGIIMSKQSKIIMAIIVGFFLVAVLYSDLWTQSAKWFKGDRTKNPDLYDLKIESMNGRDTHTMYASKGQIIVVKYDITEGQANLEISRKGGAPIYNEKGIKQASISFDVTESGEYTIILRAKRAKGMLRVEIIDLDLAK